MDDPVCLADFESRAEARLPADVWDFVAGGSGTETTLAANRAALDAVAVLPRVLTGSGVADTRCRLLAGEASMPVATAPMAYQRLVHPDGELALAVAARDAGVPFVASTLSSVPLADIAAVGGVVWFQLYWLRQRSRVDELLAVAEQAGCQAIMVTVDVPMMGRRLRDVRNRFSLPADVVAANLLPTAELAPAMSTAHVKVGGASAVAVHTEELFAPALSWADLEWLRQRVTLPLVVKGILDPRDAVRAAELGADAVVVSNHGGRQLDGAAASVAALPAVVDAVGALRATGRGCEVLLDSGIRGGVDVLRALALGASGVLVGRPLLWGLAVDGASGARQVLSLLAAELRDALTLAGCADLAAARTLAVLANERGTPR